MMTNKMNMEHANRQISYSYGRPYTDEMIMTVLTARHIGRKMRQSGTYKPFVSRKPEKHDFSAELLALIKQPIPEKA